MSYAIRSAILRNKNWWNPQGMGSRVGSGKRSPFRRSDSCRESAFATVGTPSAVRQITMLGIIAKQGVTSGRRTMAV